MIQRWMAIPVGYAMEHYGHKKGYIAIEWLGHYLSCKGTKKVLTPELAEIVRDECSYKWPDNDWTGSFWTTLAGSTKSIQNPHKSDLGKSDMLYYTLGKSLIRRSFKEVNSAEDFERYTETMWHLLDYYTFYPTCHSANSHGRTCSCLEYTKTYKGITILHCVDYPRWLYKVSTWIAKKIRTILFRLYRKYCYAWVGKRRLTAFLDWTLKIRTFFGDNGKWGIKDKHTMDGYLISIAPPWCGVLDIEISDRIFTWFGKPFYTVCHAEVK